MKEVTSSITTDGSNDIALWLFHFLILRKRLKVSHSKIPCEDIVLKNLKLLIFFSKNACRALPCWIDSIYIPKRCIITIEEYIGYQLLRHDDIPSDVWENTNSGKEKIVKMLFMGRYYLGFNEPHEGDWQKLNV